MQFYLKNHSVLQVVSLFEQMKKTNKLKKILKIVFEIAYYQIERFKNREFLISFVTKIRPKGC